MQFDEANYVIPPARPLYLPRSCDLPAQANALYHQKFAALLKELITRTYEQYNMPYRPVRVLYVRRKPRCRVPNRCLYRVELLRESIVDLDVDDQGHVKELIRDLKSALPDGLHHMEESIYELGAGNVEVHYILKCTHNRGVIGKWFSPISSNLLPRVAP